MRRLPLFLIFVLGSASIPVHATTYVIKPDGSGNFPTIQAAIDAAEEGDIIELTNGIFTGEGNRDIDFLGKAIVVRSQDGDPNVCTVDCEATSDDQHQGFTFQSGEGPNSILEGITVANGDRTIGWGGGVRCISSSPALSNLILTGNHADKGGALVCAEGASPTITGVTVIENSADAHGGGIFLDNTAAPELTDVTFLDNSATRGGGLHARFADPSMSGVTFEGNSASWGGGIFLWSGTYSFSNVTLSSNSANRGGAIALDGEPPSGPVTLELSDSQILGNTATHDGGGIWCWQSHTTIHLAGVLLEGNTAGLHGGAIAGYESTSDTFTDVTFSGNHCDGVGGAMWCIDSSPIFANVIFSENTASQGGALSCYSSAPELTHTTFFANSASEGGAVFGGYQNHYTLANVTFHQNFAADDEGAGIYVVNSSLTAENSIIAFSPVGAAIRCGINAMANLTCCDVIGNTGGDWIGCIADQMEINGNFSLDPLFCGSQNPEEPLTLHEDSPCAPENNPECGLVGAWPVGCGPTSSAPDDEPAREMTTWGQIKAAHRR